jgi:hypothetical protein
VRVHDERRTLPHSEPVIKVLDFGVSKSTAPELPPALAGVVMRCLEKTPARRWLRSRRLQARP